MHVGTGLKSLDTNQCAGFFTRMRQYKYQWIKTTTPENQNSMNCKCTYQYFQSKVGEEAFLEHLKGCETCSLLVGRISETMAVLDEPFEVQSDLTEKVLRQIKSEVVIGRTSSIDLTKYLQLAAVVAVGIFLGVLLGSRANPMIFLSKKEKKERALIEYRESHHLNDPSTIYSF